MEGLIASSLVLIIAAIPALILFIVICGIFVRAGRAADRLENISAQLASLGEFLAKTRAEQASQSGRQGR